MIAVESDCLERKSEEVRDEKGERRKGELKGLHAESQKRKSQRVSE